MAKKHIYFLQFSLGQVSRETTGVYPRLPVAEKFAFAVSPTALWLGVGLLAAMRKSRRFMFPHA